MVASVLLISVIATWVTSRFVEPRLATLAVDILEDDMPETTTNDGRGLWASGLTLVAIVLFFASGLYAPDAWLRQGNELLASAFMKGIVVVISLTALLCGLAFARASGRWQRSDDLITAMENSMAGMAGYLVLMFFAAQFTAWFGWSQLGIITAITGADFLTSLNTSPIILLLGFVLIAALINLFIGSGSAKWALLAPVFVPMLMLVGIAPETAQVAFRIGDSSTNIITPLMPYFGVVLAFAQRYRADLGIGTVMAMMLPYSIAFLLGWSALLALWLGFGWPLGW